MASYPVSSHREHTQELKLKLKLKLHLHFQLHLQLYLKWMLEVGLGSNYELLIDQVISLIEVWRKTPLLSAW